MAYSPDMMMSPESGPIGPGEPMDIVNHPEMDHPAPGYAPNMKHSMDMAGEVIPIAPYQPAGTEDMARIGHNINRLHEKLKTNTSDNNIVKIRRSTKE